jgi:hypothetical protein
MDRWEAPAFQELRPPRPPQAVSPPPAARPAATRASSAVAAREPPPGGEGRQGWLRRGLLAALGTIVVAGALAPTTTNVVTTRVTAPPTSTFPPAVESSRPPPSGHGQATVVNTSAESDVTAGARRALPAPASPRTPSPPVEPRPKPAPALPERAPATEPVGALPSAGYVLPGGHYMVDARARTILDFTVDSRCAGSIVLPPIPIATTGVFGFAGHPPGTPTGTIARVTGRFVSPRTARGTTQVSRRACRGTTISFVARVS